MWMHTRADAGRARNPVMTAISSMRLFVVLYSPSETSHCFAMLPSARRATSIAAYPPGPPGLPAQAPSVQTSYVRSLGEATMSAVCRTRSTRAHELAPLPRRYARVARPSRSTGHGLPDPDHDQEGARRD